MAKAVRDPSSELVYPVYLDVEMLISFLAALEDGISYSSEVAERTAAAREGEGEGAAKGGLPSVVSLLGLNLSAEGRYRRKSTSEDTIESKFVREHTAASLFNRLRTRLITADRVVRIQEGAAGGSTVAVGSLVEFRGVVTGNPLKQLLDLFIAIGPYFGVDIGEVVEEHAGSDARPGKRAKPGGSGPRSQVPRLATAGGENPDLSVQEILRILKREVERSPVIDLLIEGGAETAVLTASRDLLSPDVEAHLIGGEFSVLGKVSAVVPEGRSTSLLRRTVFGYGGEQMAEALMEAFPAQSEGFDFSLARTIVPGPAIQVLPLAIHI